MHFLVSECILIFTITAQILACLLANFLLSISGHIHGIYNLCDAAMSESSFSCVCLVIDNEFHRNIVKVAVDP